MILAYIKKSFRIIFFIPLLANNSLYSRHESVPSWMSFILTFNQLAEQRALVRNIARDAAHAGLRRVIQGAFGAAAQAAADIGQNALPQAAPAVVGNNANNIAAVARHLAYMLNGRAERAEMYSQMLQLLSLGAIVAVVAVEEFIRTGPPNLLLATKLHLTSFFGKDAVNALLANSIAQNDASMISTALWAGADVTKKFADEMTPLHLAAQANSADIVTSLLEKGALVNARMFGDLTPMHIAALYASEEVIRELVKRGAQVNARGHTGITPLHLAACAGNTKTIKALLQRGADVNPLDGNNETPLDAARREQHYKAALLLADNDGVAGETLLSKKKTLTRLGNHKNE